MKHKIKNIRKILSCLYEMLFICLVIIFLEMVFFKEDAGVIDALCIVSCVGLSYIIRELAQNNIFTVAFHILYGVILLFLPVNSSLKFMICVLIIAFLIPSSMAFAGRNSVLKPVNDAPWPSVLTGFIIYIFGRGMKNEMITNFAYISVIIMLVLYLLMVYCYGVEKYIEQSEDVSGLPISRILSVNSRIVIFTAAIMLIFMILGRYIDFTSFYNIIYNAVTKIVRAISIVFSLILRFISGFISTGTTQSESSAVESITETAVANQGVFGTMEVFLKIVVALILIFFLYKILSRIFKLLLKPRNFEDDIVLVAEPEKKDITENRFDKLKRKFYISKEERARKIYKKKVLEYRESIGLNKFKTCQDIKEQIENNKGNVDELTSIYEEIRYNGRQVENNLIKRMTKLSREDKKHER